MAVRDGLQAGAGQWALGIGEQNPAGREPIDIRCLRLKMSSEATRPVIEIIDRDEEHIGGPRAEDFGPSAQL